MPDGLLVYLLSRISGNNGQSLLKSSSSAPVAEFGIVGSEPALCIAHESSNSVKRVQNVFSLRSYTFFLLYYIVYSSNLFSSARFFVVLSKFQPGIHKLERITAWLWLRVLPSDHHSGLHLNSIVAFTTLIL